MSYEKKYDMQAAPDGVKLTASYDNDTFVVEAQDPPMEEETPKTTILDYVLLTVATLGIIGAVVRLILL